MPLTEEGVLRLWILVRSPKILVVRSVDVATRLQEPRVVDEPFFERAWLAKGHNLTLKGKKVKLDCENLRQKRGCLRNSPEMLRSENAYDRSCCSSRCSCPDYEC